MWTRASCTTDSVVVHMRIRKESRMWKKGLKFREAAAAAFSEGWYVEVGNGTRMLCNRKEKVGPDQFVTRPIGPRRQSRQVFWSKLQAVIIASSVANNRQQQPQPLTNDPKRRIFCCNLIPGCYRICCGNPMPSLRQNDCVIGEYGQ